MSEFKCQETCGGKCCKSSPGEGAYVFLTLADRDNLIRQGKSEYLFRGAFQWTRFINKMSLQWAIQKKPNGDCVFLEDGKCSVYHYRPTQCRTFPFWPEHWITKFKNAKSWCPGFKLNDKGELDLLTEYQTLVNEQLQADMELCQNIVE